LSTAAPAAAGGNWRIFNVGWHVTVKVAHRNPLSLRQAGYCTSIAALLVFFGGSGPQRAAAADTRTISFHHTHTNEDLTVTYKVNGRYDEAALVKINHYLRDWREDEPIRMDPELIDLLWEVHRETGAKEPIWIVCGYRSPSTNSALRRRSSGVAKFSQHMLGKAIDFYIPGVPLDQLRAAGLRAQRGGVGYYPSSSFVHMDTGSVRHWPRMPEEQLVAVLAKGQLASHNASDPRGTQVAQGDIQRKPKPFGLLAKLFGGGKDEDEDEAAAAPAKKPAAAPTRAVASMTPAPSAAAAKPAEAKVAAVPLPTRKPAQSEVAKAETYQVASADSQPVAKLVVASAAGFGLASTTYKPVILAKDDSPAAKPAIVAADDSAPKSARPAQASSLVAQADMSANDIINQRGYWQGLPASEPAEPRPASAAAVSAQRPAPAAKRAATASAEPATTASVTPWAHVKGDNEPLPNALSYAAQPTPIAGARTMPNANARTATATQGDNTVAAKQSEDRVAVAPSNAAAPTPAALPKVKGANLVRVGDRFNDPWMRAMIVSPQSHMRTTVYGVQDYRNLGPYMQKPATTVAMTFANDPLFGMSTERFTGGAAVVFTPTVQFHPRTAALK
jgi:uncharacterized protein YcbK (DUF882 family)